MNFWSKTFWGWVLQFELHSPGPTYNFYFWWSFDFHLYPVVTLFLLSLYSWTSLWCLILQRLYFCWVVGLKMLFYPFEIRLTTYFWFYCFILLLWYFLRVGGGLENLIFKTYLELEWMNYKINSIHTISGLFMYNVFEKMTDQECRNLGTGIPTTVDLIYQSKCEVRFWWDLIL